MSSREDVGRVPTAPGSREPDPQAVPALSGFDPSRMAILIRTVGERRAVAVSYMHSMEVFEEMLKVLTPAHLDCEYSAIPRDAVATGKDWFQRTIDSAAEMPWIRRDALKAIAMGTRHE